MDNVTNNLTSMTIDTDMDSDNSTVGSNELPVWQEVFWTLSFGCMVLIATGGNLIVIWTVLTNKRMRTVTNYFIVNLSIADTMLSTLNVIFNFLYMLNGHWPFGDTYCKVSNFIAILSVAASVFTLTAISIDRYTAIMYPLRRRMKRRTSFSIMAIIWLGSGFLSFPNLLFSRTRSEPEERVICYIHWPDGPSAESFWEYVYNLIILLVTYMLPITSMTVTYSKVGVKLWGSQSIGEETAKQISRIQSKRKIVKMMIAVVLIFSICWLPYHGFFLLLHHYPEIMVSQYVQNTYFFIYWLAMSNSMYNPIIYCWMNSRFREGFRKALLCNCSCSKTRTGHEIIVVDPESRRRNYSFSEASTTGTLKRSNASGSGNNLSANFSLDTCLELSNGSVYSPKTQFLSPKMGPKSFML